MIYNTNNIYRKSFLYNNYVKERKGKNRNRKGDSDGKECENEGVYLF